MVKRSTWLSITPESERELPRAVATLRARGLGGDGFPDAVGAEQARIERLVLRGSQRRWLAYLGEVVRLIERCSGTDDGAVRAARVTATRVVANHHNLLLGLSGPGARLTADDRARLGALEEEGLP